MSPVATSPKTAAKVESGDTGKRTEVKERGRSEIWPILRRKEEKEQEIKVKLWGRR